MAQTHYETLQVTEGASEEVIRGAYRHLSQKWHPDRHPDRARAETVQRDINAAYAVLSDPAARRAYDAELARQRASGRAQERPQQAPPASDPAGLDPKLRATMVNELAGQHGWVVGVPATVLALLLMVAWGWSGMTLLLCVPAGLLAVAAWNAWRKPRYKAMGDAELVARHQGMEERISGTSRAAFAVLVLLGFGYYARQRDAPAPSPAPGDPAALAAMAGTGMATPAPQPAGVAPAMRVTRLRPEQYVVFSFDLARPSRVQVSAILDQGPAVDIYLLSAAEAVRWEIMAARGEDARTPLRHYPKLGIEGLRGQFASEPTPLDAGSYALLLENTGYGATLPSHTADGDIALLRYTVTAQ